MCMCRPIELDAVGGLDALEHRRRVAEGDAELRVGWPVEMESWVSASTPGVTRSSTRWRAPVRTSRSRRSRSSGLSTTT